MDPRGVPGMRTPPGGPNSFIFMQFLAKFWKKLAILGVGAPPWGKSWIRHWMFISLDHLTVLRFHKETRKQQCIWSLIDLCLGGGVCKACLNTNPSNDTTSSHPPMTMNKNPPLPLADTAPHDEKKTTSPDKAGTWEACWDTSRGPNYIHMLKHYPSEEFLCGHWLRWISWWEYNLTRCRWQTLFSE